MVSLKNMVVNNAEADLQLLAALLSVESDLIFRALDKVLLCNDQSMVLQAATSCNVTE